MNAWRKPLKISIVTFVSLLVVFTAFEPAVLDTAKFEAAGHRPQ